MNISQSQSADYTASSIHYTDIAELFDCTFEVQNMYFLESSMSGKI